VKSRRAVLTPGLINTGYFAGSMNGEIWDDWMLVRWGIRYQWVLTDPDKWDWDDD
jgi:hypothetical protein